MRRLDLRGRRPLRARDLRGVAAAGGARRRARAGDGPADLPTDVRERGVAALLELTERFDGVRLGRRSGSRPRRSPRRSTSSTPRSGPRSRSRSGAPALVHRDQRRTDITRRWCPAARSPSGGSRSTGSASTCPGGLAVYPSSVVMNVVPAQEAGVAVARRHRPPPQARASAACRTRRSWPRARCSASTRCTRSAAPRRSRCSPTAPGDDDGALRSASRSTSSPARATSTSRPPSACCAGVIGIDAEAGPDRDRRARRRHRRPGARRRRPDQPGRARPARRRRCWSPTRETLADAVEARAGAPGRGHQAHRAGRHARWPARSRRSSWSTTSTPALAVVDAYAAEHLEIQTRDAAAVAARVRNAGAIFVGPCSPVSLGDYCAGSNHVLPTGGCACHSSGLSVQTFLRGVHVVEYDEPALPTSRRPRASRWPTPRTCPRTARPSRPGSRTT